MKTTLNLDDHLLRSAKQLAAAEGTTLTAVVEDALRARLEAARIDEGEDLYPELAPIGPPGLARRLLDEDRSGR